MCVICACESAAKGVRAARGCSSSYTILTPFSIRRRGVGWQAERERERNRPGVGAVGEKNGRRAARLDLKPRTQCLQLYAYSRTTCVYIYM